MRPVLLVPFALLACAHAPSTRDGAPAAIPVFRADDSRIGTAGFVQQTLRIHAEHDGVRYTLMAFAVGDTLTLGAMVRGSFRGEVRMQVGAHDLRWPFDVEHPPQEVDIAVDGGRGASRIGHGASFRGTAWVNVELPLSAWLRDGDPLHLEFLRDDGTHVDLPSADQHYVTRFEPRAP